ncbi:MAG: serpin family protein [Tenuifilaceae bacterium]
MKIKILFLSILVLTLSCEKEQSETIREPKQFTLPANATDVIYKSNSFGIDLFKGVANEEEGNFMLSPLSASSALTMLLNGCEENTYTQIQQMLGFEGMTISEINETYKSLVGQLLSADPKIKLALANSIWYRSGFNVKPLFLNAMENDFSAHVEALDFNLPSALTTMNKWANDNTYGKIPKVLNEISPDAVMFLMNALYFKGTWTYQFDKSKTSTDPFYLENSSSINVDMMHGTINARCSFETDYQAIELNYGRTNYSMIVIVPADNINDFTQTFSNTEWNILTQNLDGIEQPLSYVVSLPKFKFSYEKQLNQQLSDMGMVDAFSPSLANLSGIADANIFVSFVKQNTFVEVNEEGTEAAAVTTIGIELTSIPSGPPSFTVNKPFVFAIRERTTNTILFIGKVVNPTL